MQVNALSSNHSPSTSYYQRLKEQQESQERLSSGKKVNSAADNAAAMAILQGMYGQVSGLDQAYENTQDSISLLNTAEGAMSGSTDIVQRIRELTIEAANGTLTNQDRLNIQEEINQLSVQVNSNAANTEFNTIKTNDGSLTGFTTQIGANTGQSMSTSISNVSSGALGINTDVSTGAAAENSLASLDNALQKLSAERAKIGATVNTLEFSGDNVKQASLNLQSAPSVIGDADIAKEASLFKTSSLQTYINMLALSKQTEQQKGVLSLLG